MELPVSESMMASKKRLVGSEEAYPCNAKARLTAHYDSMRIRIRRLRGEPSRTDVRSN